MSVDLIGQSRFKIVDSSGDQHIACCPVCALKLIKTYGELNITSFYNTIAISPNNDKRQTEGQWAYR